MVKDTATKLVPELRFKDNNGNDFPDWEKNKLNYIFERITQKNKDSAITTVLTNSAVQGIVSQEDYFDREITNENNIKNYYIVQVNDFVYNSRVSSSAPFGPIRRNTLGLGIMSPLYTILKIKKGDISYLENYFKSSFWHRYMYKISNQGARYDRMSFAIKDFFNMPVPFPSLDEQEKIADFLDAADNYIQNLKSQKEELEKYKKGIMQKIFSQEIRFKDDNGNDFPDWMKIKINDLGDIYNGLSGKTKEDFGEGKRYIQYKQIFDKSCIDISKCGLVKINEKEKQNTAIYGDIFFTTSSETPNEVAYASVLLEKEEGLYLNSFCFGFRVKDKNKLYPNFSRYLFRNNLFRKSMYRLAQGSTRYNISKSHFVKTTIRLPNYREQQKIADFLTNIDNLIDTKQKQVVLAENWKKGLMQEMFV